MTDVEKPTQIMTEDTVAAKGDVNGFSKQENAVGYKEYREALSIEVSNKEVCCLQHVMSFHIRAKRLYHRCAESDGSST